MATTIHAGGNDALGSAYTAASIPPAHAGHSRVPSETFAERQIVHFAMVLGRKWACPQQGHEMCFTSERRHVKLTDDHIMKWVTALCNGEATTSYPPFPLEEDDSDVLPLSSSSEDPPTYSYAATTPPLVSNTSITPPSLNHIPLSYQAISLSPILQSNRFSLEQQNALTSQQQHTSPVLHHSPLGRTNSKNLHNSPNSSPRPIIRQRTSSSMMSTMSAYSTASASSFHSVATSLGGSGSGSGSRSGDTDSRTSSILMDSRSSAIDSRFSVVGSRTREKTSSVGTGSNIGDVRDLALDIGPQSSGVASESHLTLMDSRGDAGSGFQGADGDGDTDTDTEFATPIGDVVSPSISRLPRADNSRPQTADSIASSIVSINTITSGSDSAFQLLLGENDGDDEYSTSRPISADSMTFGDSSMSPMINLTSRTRPLPITPPNAAEKFGRQQRQPQIQSQVSQSQSEPGIAPAASIPSRFGGTQTPTQNQVQPQIQPSQNSPGYRHSRSSLPFSNTGPRPTLTFAPTPPAAPSYNSNLNPNPNSGQNATSQRAQTLFREFSPQSQQQQIHIRYPQTQTQAQTQPQNQFQHPPRTPPQSLPQSPPQSRSETPKGLTAAASTAFVPPASWQSSTPPTHGPGTVPQHVFTPPIVTILPTPPRPETLRKNMNTPQSRPSAVLPPLNVISANAPASQHSPSAALTPRETHTPRQLSVSSYNTTASSMTTNTGGSSDSSGQLVTIRAFPDPPAHTPTTAKSANFGRGSEAGGASTLPYRMQGHAEEFGEREWADRGQGQGQNQHQNQSQESASVMSQAHQNHSQLSDAQSHGSGGGGGGGGGGSSIASGSHYSQNSTLSENPPPILQAHFNPRKAGTTSSDGSSGSASSSSPALALGHSTGSNPPSVISASSPLRSLSHASHASNSSGITNTSTTGSPSTKQPPNKFWKDVPVAPVGVSSPKKEFPLSSRRFWKGTAGPGLALAEEFRLDSIAMRQRQAQTQAQGQSGGSVYSGVGAASSVGRTSSVGGGSAMGGGTPSGKGKDREVLLHANSSSNSVLNRALNGSVDTSLHGGGVASPSGSALGSVREGGYAGGSHSGGGGVIGSSSGSSSSIPRSVVSNPERGVQPLTSANLALSASHSNLLNPTHGTVIHGDANVVSSATNNAINQNVNVNTIHPVSEITSPVGQDRAGADSPHLSSFDGSMTDLTGGGRSVWSPYTSFLPSLTTSGLQAGLVESTRTKWIESAALSKRAKTHLARLKKWRKRANEFVLEGKKAKGKEGERVGDSERAGVVEMMGDAIEMARGCYAPRVHKLAYEVGKELQGWLQVFTESDAQLLKDQQNVMLTVIVQTCIIPIILTRISEVDPTVLPLATDLVTALTKVPLALHDNEIPLFTPPSPHPPRSRSRMTFRSRTSQPAYQGIGADPVVSSRSSATSTASIAIHLVSRELGLLNPTCESQHSWLGLYLLRIVEWTMTMRELCRGELEAMRGMVKRREMEYNSPETDPPTPIPSRPWEVALFALCASQTTVFRNAVLGPIGLPLLVTALDGMLHKDIDMDRVKWEDVALNLRAMAFLSEHRWVVDGVEEECEVLVTSIMGVFRRSIPTRWFSIRFWAMDTIRNIMSHRPPLVRILIAQDAAAAFATLTPSSKLYPQLVGNRGSVNAQSKSRPKIMDDYRKEAAKRAEEMVNYIKNWKDWQPFMQNLAPVSIGMVGNGTSGL